MGVVGPHHLLRYSEESLPKFLPPSVLQLSPRSIWHYEELFLAQIEQNLECRQEGTIA
jgi:hypothetical protein